MKINAIFRSVLENEAGELKGRLDEMEQKRLDRVIGRYEEAAEDGCSGWQERKGKGGGSFRCDRTGQQEP
ncbi:MAG: hypothetical protein ACLUOI_18510 [Eisenbergiella sp.]